jgi:hypothetical protein
MKENNYIELNNNHNYIIITILATSLIICIAAIHTPMPILFTGIFVPIGQLFLIVSLMMDEIKRIVALFGIILITIGIAHTREKIIDVTVIPYSIAVITFVLRMIHRSFIQKKN